MNSNIRSVFFYEMQKQPNKILRRLLNYNLTSLMEIILK